MVAPELLRGNVTSVRLTNDWMNASYWLFGAGEQGRTRRQERRYEYNRSHL